MCYICHISSAPPHVHASRNLTSVEGNDVTLDFSVVAEPPVSSLTFHYNGLQLSTNGVVTVLPGGTSLIVRGSPRTSTGNYTLVAHNSLGSGSASIWLNVLCMLNKNDTQLHNFLICSIMVYTECVTQPVHVHIQSMVQIYFQMV